MILIIGDFIVVHQSSVLIGDIIVHIVHMKTVITPTVWIYVWSNEWIAGLLGNPLNSFSTNIMTLVRNTSGLVLWI